ncbi:MAG: CorA family divalent cation transporter, partial [Pseudomonadota bacterium]
QRYLEEMDASRGRSVVIKNDLINRLNQTMNKNMYAISVIAAIFLPLSFLTGLLGINVGGMPGVENSFAFWITCIVMVILLVVQVWLFRKLKWLWGAGAEAPYAHVQQPARTTHVARHITKACRATRLSERGA